MTTSAIPKNLALASVLLSAWLFASPSSAEPRAAELRFQFFSPSYRWSSSISGASDYNLYGRTSLHMSPGIGGRYFPKHGSHGALLQMEYRFDLAADDPWCLFGTPNPCPYSKVEYAVFHMGYAYRHIVESPRRPGSRFWAFTPHLSLSTGWAKHDPVADAVPERSPVIGARVGFDVDLHFGRWFIGWSIRYEGLAQTRGPNAWSHFFGWNAIPLFQMGVDLGPVHPQTHAPDGYPRRP